MDALNQFFEKVKEDGRIWPTHISLYVALLSLRNERYGSDFLLIDREKLMARSRILSKATYYRCLKELAEFGLIEYRPEHHPGGRTSVCLNRDLGGLGD